MDLVPAPAVRLMKRRVLSRPGVNSLIPFVFPFSYSPSHGKDRRKKRKKKFGGAPQKNRKKKEL